MIPKWPKYVFIDDSSIEEIKISNQVRTSFDRGLEKTRPLNSLSIYQLKFDVYIDISDYENFDYWLNNILRDRTSFFLMKCPIRGKEYKFRFLDGDLNFKKEFENMTAQINLERLEDCVHR